MLEINIISVQMAVKTSLNTSQKNIPKLGYRYIKFIKATVVVQRFRKCLSGINSRLKIVAITSGPKIMRAGKNGKARIKRQNKRSGLLKKKH